MTVNNKLYLCTVTYCLLFETLPQQDYRRG